MQFRDAVNWVALVVLGLAWGLTVPLTKISVSTGYHPLGLIFWQFVIAVALLGIIVAARRTTVVVDRKHLGFYGVIALIGTLIPNTFSYWAVFHLPAGIMGIIIASVPMFALVIGLVLRVEGVDFKRLAGVVLGLVAVAIITLPETSLPDPAKVGFVLLALLAPFCYGCEANYLIVRAPGRIDPVATLMMASVIGAVLSAPMAWLAGGFINPVVAFGTVEFAFVTSATLHALAYCGYIWLVARAGAVFGSQIAYVVTLAAVLLSGVILGESYSAWIWMALLLMIGGISLVKPAREAEIQVGR